jgi:hypothetical protein
MSDHICAEVGADVAELPYIAELLDLKADQSRWRLAVEKVLRGAGLRLLVPDQHWEKVLRFVNETDMRGRLQLHHVRAKLLGAEPVDPEPNTLAGKLFAVDPKHPCAAEAVDVITSAGDHVCVETPTCSPDSAVRSPTPGCTRTPTGWPSRTTGDRSSSPNTCTRATCRPRSTP